jgi:hypothetical protein
MSDTMEPPEEQGPGAPTPTGEPRAAMEPAAAPPPAATPAAPPPMPGQPMMSATKSNGFAVASLVLGILTLVLFFTIWLPFVLGALAIVFGALGISKANKGAGQKGMAIAGLICGAVGVVITIAFLALFVIVANNKDVQDIFSSVIQSLETPSP